MKKTRASALLVSDAAWIKLNEDFPSGRTPQKLAVQVRFPLQVTMIGPRTMGGYFVRPVQGPCASIVGSLPWSRAGRACDSRRT